MDQVQINQEESARRRDLMYLVGQLNSLRDEFHGRSKSAGWWSGVDFDVQSNGDIRFTDPNVLASKIALIHSEASEMLEGMRKDTWDDHIPGRPTEEVECVDLLIRIFDYAGARNLDLVGAMFDKSAYNEDRADHKPEARAGEHGKKI